VPEHIAARAVTRLTPTPVTLLRISHSCRHFWRTQPQARAAKSAQGAKIRPPAPDGERGRARGAHRDTPQPPATRDGRTDRPPASRCRPDRLRCVR